MKDNKIIAEFMGVVFHDDDNQYYNSDGLYIGLNLQYHTSWDWLMPVIEEIDHLQYESIDSIENALATRSIKDTYKAVVKFLRDENLMNHSQFLKWREEKMEKWGETEAEFEESHRLPTDK
jgi:hypothetical protein|tara:strand:- start:223 stop:585 length:363 start_codon:yes stop_codon:yes gene_type:complete